MGDPFNFAMVLFHDIIGMNINRDPVLHIVADDSGRIRPTEAHRHHLSPCMQGGIIKKDYTSK
jgi:hypothetical protein